MLQFKSHRVEDAGKVGTDENSLVYVQSPHWWFLFFLILLLVSVVTFIVTAVVLANVPTSISSWVLLVVSALFTTFCVWALMNHKRITEDRLGVVQIFSGSEYVWDSPMFTPPGSVYVDFPASQFTQRTPEKAAESRALVVQLRQGMLIEDDGDGNLSATDANGLGHSDEQVVVIQFTGRLAIRTAPRSVVEAFFEDFRLRNGETREAAVKRAFENKVLPDVMDIIIAMADAILQKYTVDQLLTNAEQANRELVTFFTPRLAKIGVEPISISVEDVKDIVNEGGYVYQRSQAVRAENEALSRQRRSDANRAAGIREAENQEKVQVREQERDLEIAKKRNAVVTQQRANEEVIERTKVLDREVELELMAGVTGDQVNNAVISRLTGDQIVELQANIARLSGLHSDGGNLTVVNAGGKPGDVHGSMQAAMPLAAGLGAMFPAFGQPAATSPPVENSEESPEPTEESPGSPESTEESQDSPETVVAEAETDTQPSPGESTGEATNTT